METVPVLVRPLESAADLPLPTYQTPASAGVDLRAGEMTVLEPGQRAAVGTGLTISLPRGYEAQIRPRSGLALRHGVTLLNTPGTIDADYRGEIRVILINLGQKTFRVQRGDRIAQMVVAPVTRIRWQAVSQLPDSHRGGGGFGSTGGLSDARTTEGVPPAIGSGPA